MLRYSSLKIELFETGGGRIKKMEAPMNEMAQTANAAVAHFKEAAIMGRTDDPRRKVTRTGRLSKVKFKLFPCVCVCTETL
ncbi:MAG TPA: hypothetical protein PKD26_00405 [Pyrinomonadaceae bacterium]|nr:hypothetical protein [Pyrinomonadaceae bacterium]